MSEDRRKNMNENIKQEAKTLEEAARPLYDKAKEKELPTVQR